jgi:hypothetical protein
MEPHVKNRAIFTFCFMLPILLVAQYFGFDSIWIAGITGGIAGGVSVVLFPDPSQGNGPKP